MTLSNKEAEYYGKDIYKRRIEKNDGQNGNPAYVAINNRVYDVTHIPAWQDGTHHGNKAELDLTDVLFDYSPHKDRVLVNLPKVGTLVGEE